jgi:hypothetical protein
MVHFTMLSVGLVKDLKGSSQGIIVIYPDTCMDGLTKNTNKLGNVRRPYHFRCVRPVSVPNVKFVITLITQNF